MSSPAAAIFDTGSHLLLRPSAAERLIMVVEQLSHEHDLAGIMKVVRLAARELTDADGATFVLRDGDMCFYAEENAIQPLWKGQRFPMQMCVSGWAMLHAQSVAIEDIYADPRVPADAYRPTFVKSLVMVPVRKERPVGAIGNYWSTRRQPTNEEVTILQALATATSVAMENADLYAQLQQQVEALKRSNEELDRFAWAAAHDLKAPLRAIDSLSSWVMEDSAANLGETSLRHLQTLRQRVKRMDQMLTVVLEYAGCTESAAQYPPTDLIDGSAMLAHVCELIEVPDSFAVEASPAFRAARFARMPLQRILCNLIDNAIRHHHRPQGTIRLDARECDGKYEISVTDDGPGIHPHYHARVFEMFRTLQRRDEREGVGMGLALVKRILVNNGESISLASDGEHGCVFTLTWPRPLRDARS